MSELDHTLVPIAPDLEDTVQEALDQRQEADDIVAAALKRGLENVYLVGCGGSHVGTFPAHDLLERYGSAFASYKVQSAELTYRPSVLVPVDEGQAAKLMRLLEALEESDDVEAVHANFDAPAEVLERVAG